MSREYYDLPTTKTEKCRWVDVSFVRGSAVAGAVYSTSIKSDWDLPCIYDYYDGFNQHDWVLVPYSEFWPKMYGKVISKCNASVTLSFDGRLGIFRRDRESEWLKIEKSI